MREVSQTGAGAAREVRRSFPANCSRLEKLCLTRPDPEAFDGLLGQRSDDPVNIAATRPGRFDSQIGCVRQDNPKRPAISNSEFGCCHHECLCHPGYVRLALKKANPIFGYCAGTVLAHIRR
jgi:hypothetical protein